jgi:hypothetical protein
MPTPYPITNLKTLIHLSKDTQRDWCNDSPKQYATFLPPSHGAAQHVLRDRASMVYIVTDAGELPLRRLPRGARL